jgi:hypothetical protein
MRIFLLAAAILLLPFSAGAQADQQTPTQSCPVQFTGVDYHGHPPQPLSDPNATTKEKSYGTFAFRYQNTTDKAVRAFHVTVHFAPPAGVRPPLLKTTSENTMHFTQSDPLAANDSSRASYEIRHAVGRFLWLRLDTVEFQDGSLWQLPENSAEGQCTFYPKAALVPAQQK